MPGSAAKCDAYLRHRRIIELKAIKQAMREILSGRLESAREILQNTEDGRKKALRADIERIAGELFEQIGLQTDVERYCADSWERGAVLETIDLPNTDRCVAAGETEKSRRKPENELKDICFAA